MTPRPLPSAVLRSPLELSCQGSGRSWWAPVLCPPCIAADARGPRAGSGRVRMGAWRGASPKLPQLGGAAGAMGARGARVALCGVALLCALGLGERPSGPSCGPGRLLRGAGTDARCCRLCSAGKARGSRSPLGRRPRRAPSLCSASAWEGRWAPLPGPEPSVPGEWVRGRVAERSSAQASGPKAESGAMGGRAFLKGRLGSQGGGRLSQLLLRGQ